MYVYTKISINTLPIKWDFPSIFCNSFDFLLCIHDVNKLVETQRKSLPYFHDFTRTFHFSGDMTGKESYYTVYAGHEVMYHISTMLPYSKDNPQQLERKRHIGNDIVNIIYTDDPSAVDTFNPNCIRSQFTRKLREISW